MFIKYPGRKSTVPIRAVVPNLFTTIAMCCGLASIQYSLKGDWDRAMFAIVLSAVFDAMDGRAARLLKVASPFGEVLDSLADFLSFGVAPALLLYLWMFKGHEDREVFGLAAVAAFVLCSAMRLARFTAGVRPDAGLAPGEEKRQIVLKSKFFTGLATPSAAAAVMVPVMLSYSKILARFVRPTLGMPLAGQGERLGELDSAANPAEDWVIVVIVAYIVLVALWMISRVPMFSFKKMRISRRAVVPILVGAGLIVILGIRDFWLLAALLSVAYLGTVLISLPSQRRIIRRPLSELPEVKVRPTPGAAVER